VLGLTVLIGWALGMPRIINPTPTWPRMTPIAALAFVLGGLSLCSTVLTANYKTRWLFVARISAVALVLIGFLKLSDNLIRWPGVFDLLGFPEAAGPGHLKPARLAPFSALSFVLLGSALLLCNSTRLLGVFQSLTLTAGLVGWLGISGYLYGGTPLLPYAQMSLLTACGLVVLSGGILCSRTDGLLRLLLSGSAGGVLARRLLLPATVLPFVFGWLRLKAQRAGWFGTEAGVSLFALANAVLFGVLVWMTARLLHRSDVKRRQMEEEMHEHMERLATVIANEPECVKVIDGTGRLVEMNPAGLAMLEADSLADAQQWQLTKFILSDYRLPFIELHRRVMRGETGILEFEIRGKRGTRRWVQTHAVPMRDKSGEIWALLGITRDVSARKRVDSAQAQVQLFRDLLDRINDLIYIADAQTARVLDCNAALPQRLGYAREEVLQMTVWDLSTAAGGPQDWTDRVARVQVSGSLVIASDYRCKDGSVFPVESSWSYVVREPRPLLVAVIRDVTERRVQEARVAHFTRALKMQSAIHGAVLRIRDPDELQQEACRVATEVGAYAYAAISLVDPDGRQARPKYHSGMSGLPDLQAFPIGDGTEPDGSVTGRALRTGELTLCSDVRQSESIVLVREHLLRLGIRSVLALPLTVDGACVGALTLLSRRTELIHDEELGLLEDVAATLGLGLRMQRHAEAAQFLTYYDPLTGLAKRALFCERLNALIHEASASVAHPIVAAFDVHDLSGFNDTFGRGFGDALMQEVADRVRRAVEHERHIGHLGGGTFVLVVRDLPSAADSVAAMIDSTVFDRPFEIEGRSVRVTSRSGLARYPRDGKDAATLVQKAEAALKQAKESGERYLHFKLHMHSDVAKRLQLEHDLREAIDAQQFVLHYQPQLNIATGTVESVEALLRWRKPQEGLVAPAQFLPVLESSEMIVTVGNWVLTQASQDCTRCRSRGLGPLRISVNVSPLQIRRRGFVEEVLRRVADCGIDGYGIDIEITETSLLQDMQDTSRKLRRLREAGIRIAIDDFGTGYSSLSLLPTLPIDILKIDRAFVRGLPADRASVSLTSSIIQIAAAFNLVTVAEGVETDAQLELLRALNCKQSQGYLHWKPMPMDDLESLLTGQLAQTRQ
jgi:diguanylate cyclase (GGDEF)-like protein/PAS domain S-box-containing protein